MKKTFLSLFALSLSFSVFADSIPDSLVGNWTPAKTCPKKFVWSEVQDSFVISKDGMQGFNGECKAASVIEKNGKYSVNWKCGSAGNLSVKYEVKSDVLTEDMSGLISKYRRCK